MQNNYIQFKQKRELGEIINATFKFIRENYKTLFKYLVSLVGPSFILLVAALSYYTYSVPASILQSMDFSSGDFIIAFSVLALTLLIYYSYLYATIYHYIKSYMKHDGETDETEIRSGVKNDFGRLLILFLVSAILMFAGFILFVIPGIYLFVPLSIVSAIMIFKQTNLTDTISYAFTLIKDNWWMTFITIIVTGLLVYVIGLVFQIPLIVYTLVKMMTMVQEGSAAEMASYSDWVLIVLQVLASLIQYILYSISVIVIAFIYFSLNEEKNLTGTFEQIDNLGK
ncbi:hypothetical protein [Gillisia limnaea]|uniref:Glycerophosphoryl diester phosphodiesterase membrane domain-containing protein n=1 Tax=Gillisia limnaea (strain DSM 15749 / LMG 21470 / R-8282) TaxID=865937 RepID=H2BV48_GILLR|nr:hypothetical protein [Gillisia limnaea]EHQ03938.1 hypothetical protein Gilli_3337 [Gillisia limnaea DSM 15749]